MKQRGHLETLHRVKSSCWRGTEKKEVTQAKCNLCGKTYLVQDFSTTGIR